MSTAEDLRELSRQAQFRIAEAQRLRAEHRVITAQSLSRLAESRALLERAAVRWQSTEPAPLRPV